MFLLAHYLLSAVKVEVVSAKLQHFSFYTHLQKFYVSFKNIYYFSLYHPSMVLVHYDLPSTRRQDIDKMLAVQKTSLDYFLDGGVDLSEKQCINSLSAKGTICSIHLELS